MNILPPVSPVESCGLNAINLNLIFRALPKPRNQGIISPVLPAFSVVLDGFLPIGMLEFDSIISSDENGAGI